MRGRLWFASTFAALSLLLAIALAIQPIMPLSLPNHPRIILVCGATGKTGSAAVSSLLDASAPVQVLALVRHPSSPAAQALQAQGATLVQGDFANPDSLKAAFTQHGVQACFLACANQPEQVQLETNVIDAAEACDTCRYLVKVGTCGAKGTSSNGDVIADYTSKDSLVEYGRFHAAIEQRLEQCNPAKLQWTCLRPNFFMQNHAGDLLATFPAIIYPHTNAKANLIDARDVGAIAAKLLLLDHDEVRQVHAAKYYDVCGPQGWSIRELADLYTKTLDTAANVVECSASAYQDGLVNGAGFPAWLAQAVTASHVHFWATGRANYESSPEIKALLPQFRTMPAWVEEMVPLVQKSGKHSDNNNAP